MDVLQTAGAIFGGLREKKERAISDMSKLQTIENQKRQGAALDFELQQAKEKDAMEGKFGPLSLIMPGWKENPELVKTWTGVLKSEGFKDHIREEQDDIYVTGKAVKHLMGMFDQGGDKAKKLTEATMSARKNDIQTNIQQLYQKKMGGPDGKAKLKPEEEQEIDKKIMSFKQMAADILSTEKTMKEEKESKTKHWGRSSDGSAIGYNEETMQYYKNGQLHTLRQGDKSEAQLSAAEGRSSTSTHIYPNKPTEYDEMMSSWMKVPEAEKKTKWGNDPYKFWDTLKRSGKASAEKTESSVKIF